MKHQSPAARQALKSALREAQERSKFAFRPAFERTQRKKPPAVKPLIAYDFETPRIRAGTIYPIYLTAYSNDGEGFAIETRIKGMPHLRDILRQQFLTEENRGSTFVAWNGNRFDAFFTAAALIEDDDLVIIPFVTRSKALRGIRVIERELQHTKNAKGWEFCDGIAMTGLAGVSLDKFTENFAPKYRKLSNVIDFEAGEEFDPDNAAHCEYAMRDSVGLWHAITNAQRIMLDTFDEPLAITMGGACIRIFQRHIPEGVKIESVTPDLRSIITGYVMRGGFCFCVDRYEGPVWKYDINQAYAAAMRDAKLPCGGALHWKGAPPSSATVFVCRIVARHPTGTIVPFYYRCERDGRQRSLFNDREIEETWITSIEYAQLVSEGWQVEVFECWIWAQSFSMKDYVDKLERLRTTCEGGPSGAMGTMVKATGNHSYGKTVEQIEPVQFVLGNKCPENFAPYYGDESDPIEHVYYAIDEDRKPKAHHQPQIGAFITASVRMVVRRAALLAPKSWLYADTDCVIFSRDVGDLLDINKSRYGAWKIEESGATYQIIAKKVYTKKGDKNERSAKGMNVKRLTSEDFDSWLAGIPPVQDQIQLQNFMAVMSGAEMFRKQQRKGTRVQVKE